MNDLLIAEQQNPVSIGLGEMSVRSILYLMNGEDHRVPEAIAGALWGRQRFPLVKRAASRPPPVEVCVERCTRQVRTGQGEL